MDGWFYSLSPERLCKWSVIWVMTTTNKPKLEGNLPLVQFFKEVCVCLCIRVYMPTWFLGFDCMRPHGLHAWLCVTVQPCEWESWFIAQGPASRHPQPLGLHAGGDVISMGPCCLLPSKFGVAVTHVPILQ